MALLPPRCFSCNKILANYNTFEKALFENKKDISKTLDVLNFKRRCCRRMYHGYIPEIEERMLQYDTKYRGGDGKTTK